jgi:hypothetical protein
MSGDDDIVCGSSVDGALPGIFTVAGSISRTLDRRHLPSWEDTTLPGFSDRQPDLVLPTYASSGITLAVFARPRSKADAYGVP